MTTLRLILGDQLNHNHSWFQNPQKGVHYLMMEMRQETDYVTHHIQKVCAFFLAMRRFAGFLENQGFQVHYLKLDDPGNAQSPWYGFASNVNTESSLRNQFFALQDCDQAKYIPSTHSDLYNATVISKNMPHPHPHLFRNEDFSPHQPNTCNIAKELFHNHTQQQLKDM